MGLQAKSLNMKSKALACVLALLAILANGCQTLEDREEYRAERQRIKTMRAIEELAEHLNQTLSELEDANR